MPTATMFVMNAIRDISDPHLVLSESGGHALKLSERQLLDAIALGELDDPLVATADAIHARRECCTPSTRRQQSRNSAERALLTREMVGSSFVTAPSACSRA
jgi:hypothetical protein